VARGAVRGVPVIPLRWPRQLIHARTTRLRPILSPPPTLPSATNGYGPS